MKHSPLDQEIGSREHKVVVGQCHVNRQERKKEMSKRANVNRRTINIASRLFLGTIK
jgi:hypothetical protein